MLRELVDARLLTSFELPASREDGRERHRVEIVHESLLASWPRLVRWQTQDAEGAQLRDQLRQAAQLWQERGRVAGPAVDGDGVPGVRAVARALPGRADGDRGGLRAGDGRAGRSGSGGGDGGSSRHDRGAGGWWLSP